MEALGRDDAEMMHRRRKRCIGSAGKCRQVQASAERCSEMQYVCVCVCNTIESVLFVF